MMSITLTFLGAVLMVENPSFAQDVFKPANIQEQLLCRRA